MDENEQPQAKFGEQKPSSPSRYWSGVAAREKGKCKGRKAGSNGNCWSKISQLGVWHSAGMGDFSSNLKIKKIRKKLRKG